MVASLSHRVLDRVGEAGGLYHRLLLVVGPPRSGKTGALRDIAASEGWPLVNVNLRLSELLLELTQKQRALRAARLLGDIVEAANGDAVLLDNIELLFGPELAQDPLRLLQGLTRNRTVVVTWCGEYDGTTLTYAEPGHPEARRYTRPEAVVVSAETAWPPQQADSQMAPTTAPHGTQETS